MLHNGHRKRMRSKFLEYGLDAFDDHNVLEFLLFFAIPRVDTNPTGHMLVDRFGTLANIFDAEFDELTEISGIGRSSAAFIKLLPAAADRYMASKTAEAFIINTSGSAAEYISPKLENSEEECAYIVFMDGKGKALGCRRIEANDIFTDPSIVKKVAEMSLQSDATSIIVVHFRPYGISAPTENDTALVQRLETALEYIDIVLMDYIIMTKTGIVSFSDNSYFKNRYITNGGEIS